MTWTLMSLVSFKNSYGNTVDMMVDSELAKAFDHAQSEIVRLREELDAARRAADEADQENGRLRTEIENFQHVAVDFFERSLGFGDDGESDAICGGCGQPMEHVRPGKWQCNHCAEITAYHATTGDWPKQQGT